ncbi:hypothetical protein [Psychromonas sp.]|uniref:hypothetical protein n=1 Tax=Psychromonas sp. TaxID=1884585 RepID=UPI0039E5F013
MIKKMMVLMLLPSLWACSHLSSEESLGNAVQTVNIKPTYIEVIGEKLRPDNLSAAGHGVLESTLFITANFAQDKLAPSSNLQMTLAYFENYQPYEFVVVDGKKTALKASQVSTSFCNEHCAAKQHFNFPITNELLLQSAASQLVFELQNNNGSKKLIFSVPGNYIKALLDSAAVNREAVVPAKQEKVQDLLVISQGLFVKATNSEKEIFTEWAFKNRKEATIKLDSESQVLTMLAYWFEQADSSQRAEILTWIISL